MSTTSSPTPSTPSVKLSPVNFNDDSDDDDGQRKQKKNMVKRRSSFADSIDREESEWAEREKLASMQQQQQQQPHYNNYPPSHNSRNNNNNTQQQQKSSMTIPISRTVVMPDKRKVDRCLRLPEYGPKILFFSGGSALKDLSGVLKFYTHHSIHLITPFDSGGSSAEIRRAFDMSSVGDLRNRLMALMSPLPTEDATSQKAVGDLFSYRLSKYEPLTASSEFTELVTGRHALTKAVSLPMRRILMSHLRWFAHRMPADFDLCGASIGNLIITGCYLEHHCDIVTAIYLIWKLLGVKGKVRPLTAANLHIRAYYDNGTIEVGQHKLGKPPPVDPYYSSSSYDLLIQEEEEKDSATPPPPPAMMIGRKIVKMDLVEELHNSEDAEEQSCRIDMVSAELVASADVICFPMGSFFGSVLVNLLPEGVGQTIVHRHCPKIYIPNTGVDAEMYGYTTLSACVQQIIDMVRADAGDDVPVSQILNFCLVDSVHAEYMFEIDKETVESLGLIIIDVPLVDNHTIQRAAAAVEDDRVLEKSQTLDPTKVVEVLLTLGS